MVAATNPKTMENPPYTLENIRLEIESGGYVTIWFDLGGSAFQEPEAMANMFVELDEFLEYLAREQPEVYHPLADGPSGHGQWLERLDAADFDWDEQLRLYIDQQIDLRAAEKERLPWLQARRARATNPDRQQMENDWNRLSAQAEPGGQPTWDDVAHALIAGLNDAAVGLYPEVLNYNAEESNHLREMLESHGERLANQLFALTSNVRKAREKRK